MICCLQRLTMGLATVLCLLAVALADTDQDGWKLVGSTDALERFDAWPAPEER